MERTFTTTPGATFSLQYGPKAQTERFTADADGVVTIPDGDLADVFEEAFVVGGIHAVTSQPQEKKRGKK